MTGAPPASRIPPAILAAIVGVRMTACGPREPPPEPPLPPLPTTRLVAQRYQAPGDLSTVGVPAVELGGERRPVLVGSPPVRLVAFTLKRPRSDTMTIDVPIPERLRGQPLRLEATLVSTASIVEQEPIVVSAAGETLQVRLRFSGEPWPLPEILTISGRRPPEDSYLSEPLVIPPGARLRLGIGFEQSPWPRGLPGATFALTVVDDAGEQPILGNRMQPGDVLWRHRWYDYDLDLARFAGRRVRLRFESRPDGPEPPFVYPAWSDPTLVVPQGEPRRRNLILISLDTLRADHLGCYGYPRPTSPTIDTELAARGTVFERAYSAYPGTDGSHMTLLTGLYPCAHGLFGEFGVPTKPLRRDVMTLAELLRAQGYATGAFTEDALLTAAFGFDRGFGVFSEARQPAIAEPRGQVRSTLNGGITWLKRQAGMPFFLFLHTYQVHLPHTPPPGYVEQVASDHGEDPASTEAALYDGEIRYTDDALAELLAALDAAGATADTLIVLTSDHGDHFGEHCLVGHGSSLYEGLLHVPLVVRGPGLVPADLRVGDPVGLVDVVPTVLELLRAPVPPRIQGRSLVPLLQGRTLPPRTLWAELPPLGLVAARTPTLKWIIYATGSGQAFDVGADPGEEHDLAPGLPPDVPKKLLDEFHALCATLGPPPEPTGPVEELDPAVREKLKALGYMN